MKPFVLALRAIGAAFAMRLFVPVAVIAAILFAVLAATTVWLTTFSDWWWLLLIPIISLLVISLTIGFVVFSLIRFVRPAQTTTQKQTVSRFIDKLQGIAEVVGTPKFIILFRVVRSISAPSKDSYLSDMVKNRELANDFRDIQRSFDN